VTDVRCVVDTIDAGTVPGKGLPLILIGHSRGGATIYRCAAHAENDPWRMKPAALVSLSATATLTRLTDDITRQLREKGYVERECARGPGGVVRMGRSWYEHHLDHPGHDYFAEAVGAVRCPVLIAHGTDDTSVEPHHADDIAEMFRKHNRSITPRVVKIAGADHNFNVLGYKPDAAMMSSPAACQLYDAIAAFLDDAL
jgi:alpha-beta hydrolase superfamily lysophospholipase